MRKVQQKQWQIFCGKVLRKLVWLGNQRVTNDLLFPFNGSRGFGADIIDDPINTFNFVDDTVGELAQQVVGKVGPVGSHSVGAGDGANGDYAFVSSGISHDTNGFYG